VAGDLRFAVGDFKTREDRAVLASLENTQFSDWMRSELWGWPLVLTLHVLGTAVVIGFIVIISLRLLGLFETILQLAQSGCFPSSGLRSWCNCSAVSCCG
jgi:hypothetical protein